MGRTGREGTGQLSGLTWSCWRRAAATTVSRAATSTLLQRLCAPPRPYSPRLPKAPPPGAQFNPEEQRPLPREPPYSLLPPGPRAASPVQSKEVEESQRVSPKIPKSSIQRSASPALPPPLLPSPRLRLLFPGRPPGPTEPSASVAFSPPPAPPARPVLASRLPPGVSSPSSCCSSSSSRSSMLHCSRPGGPGQRLLSSLSFSFASSCCCFF